MTAVHRRHDVFVQPVSGGCSFFAGDPTMAFAAPTPDVALLDGQCRRRADYMMTDSAGNEAAVCATHAAHVRTCPKCTTWVTSIRSIDMEGV